MRSPNDRRSVDELDRLGYCLLPSVWSDGECREIAGELCNALNESRECAGPLVAKVGRMYAARNVLDIWPPAAKIWRKRSLVDFLEMLLGPTFGLVRALYFDKPPEQSWALPWHQDRTVALREPPGDGSPLRRPTLKAGVPHAEAPREVLQRMITLRLHLDDMTTQNGPLVVLPGSHRFDDPVEANGPSRPILARAGDVLVMRPLLWHASEGAEAGTVLRRRVLHWEFAADGCPSPLSQWRWFATAAD